MASLQTCEICPLLEYQAQINADPKRVQAVDALVDQLLLLVVQGEESSEADMSLERAVEAAPPTPVERRAAQNCAVAICSRVCPRYGHILDN